ncbi:unnamed protein product [Acanthosepion pharaonis]|uniref:Uncharacterized protein n=1 Tax=Acanthosepion pharaonis TaxID=158019 RepID=A0A812CWV7_ACAPH|nr:unnamed protein product [Sepia pharaonis]
MHLIRLLATSCISVYLSFPFFISITQTFLLPSTLSSSIPLLNPFVNLLIKFLHDNLTFSLLPFPLIFCFSRFNSFLLLLLFLFFLSLFSPLKLSFLSASYSLSKSVSLCHSLFISLSLPLFLFSYFFFFSSLQSTPDSSFYAPKSPLPELHHLQPPTNHFSHSTAASAFHSLIGFILFSLKTFPVAPLPLPIHNYKSFPH